MLGIDGNFSGELVILAERPRQFQLQPLFAFGQRLRVESITLLQIAAEESLEYIGVLALKHWRALTGPDSQKSSI
jgi:hypothetical protein